MRNTMRVTYGAAATAHWEGSRDTLTVSLDHDPGTGAMLFTRISPQVVEWVAGTDDDRRRFAGALERGARYLNPGPTRDRLEAAARELGGVMLDGVEIRPDRDGLIGYMSDWGAPYARDWIGRGLVESVPHNSGGLGGSSYRLTAAGRVEIDTQRHLRSLNAHADRATD